MKIYDREKQEYYDEFEYGNGALEFLYHNFFGRIILKTVVASRWLSKLVGVYQKSSLSKGSISKFIAKNNIDMTEFKDVKEYKCFSEFFRREKDIKISNDITATDFVSVADSKLQVFNITKDLVLDVKHSKYNILDIVKDEEIAKEYSDGLCLVFRLAVNDYHRYIFFDEGKLLSKKYIKGKLHTVRAISKEFNVFSRNSREVSVLDTKHFGKAVQIEVGAMLIGKIVNHDKKEFKKFEEKGFFDYGGSTIVLLLKKDEVVIDEDIMKNSNEGFETQVKVGMKIGKKA